MSEKGCFAAVLPALALALAVPAPATEAQSYPSRPIRLVVGSSPRGTGPGVVNFLNAQLQAVIDDPRGKQRLVEFGCEPVGGPARSFAELVRADYRAWGPIVRDAGVKLE